MKKGTKKNKELSVGKDFDKEKELLTELEEKEKSVANGTIELHQPKSIYEIWGVQKKSEYQFLEESEYKKQLQNMNKVDLQRECLRCSEIPRDSRESMVNALMKKFRGHKNRLETAGIKPKMFTNHAEIEKLLDRR